MKKLFIGIVILLVIGAIVYALGPRVSYEAVSADIPVLAIPNSELDAYIAKKEGKITDMKPDNEARIIWHDTAFQKTPYSVVYLHGFSSSQEEGDPIHTNFAQRYGCNLFLSRLDDHGRVDSNSFREMTPESLMESAREAVAIGNMIGENVIVISCSTGGTLSAYLAAENPDMIHSQIMYSPNIDIYDPLSAMLTKPWGYQLAEWTFKGEYNRIDYPPLSQKYWNEIYHINGAIAVKDMIEQTMNEETFKKIEQPLFMGYYYIDEERQDKVVSVERMHEFFSQISTPEDQKKKMSFPTAGRHVIASHVMSGDVETVQKETFLWAESVLKLVPATK